MLSCLEGAVVAGLELEQFVRLLEGCRAVLEADRLVDFADQKGNLVGLGSRGVEDFAQPVRSPFFGNPLDDLDHLVVVMTGQALAGQFLERHEILGREARRAAATSDFFATD